MPQAKLIKAEQVENGVKLTFLNAKNEQFSGIYNNEKLSVEDILKLVGNDISYSETEKHTELNIHKAWNKKESPTYCDDPRHALDR